MLIPQKKKQKIQKYFMNSKSTSYLNTTLSNKTEKLYCIILMKIKIRSLKTYHDNKRILAKWEFESMRDYFRLLQQIKI